MSLLTSCEQPARLSVWAWGAMTHTRQISWLFNDSSNFHWYLERYLMFVHWDFVQLCVNAQMYEMTSPTVTSILLSMV